MFRHEIMAGMRVSHHTTNGGGNRQHRGAPARKMTNSEFPLDPQPHDQEENDERSVIWGRARGVLLIRTGKVELEPWFCTAPMVQRVRHDHQ